MKDPYCSICRTPVNVYTWLDGMEPWLDDMGVEYEHSRPGHDDHQPVLIPLADLPNPLQFCDFCSEEDPQWRFTSTREVELKFTDGRVDRLGRVWLACSGCADLITDRDMERLLTKVIATFEHPGLGDTIKDLLIPVYTHLFAEVGNKEPNQKGNIDE